MLSKKRNRLYVRTPVADRLWDKVEKTDTCWNWIGKATHQFGYGIMRVSGNEINTSKTVAAHRISWEIANGPIPPGLFVLHRCDNPRCVRPDHLFLGTIADNNRDMWSKNRGNRTTRPRGLDHHATKLTDDDIRDIRRRRAAGEVYRTIAADFGVTITTAQRVVTQRQRIDHELAAEIV